VNGSANRTVVEICYNVFFELYGAIQMLLLLLLFYNISCTDHQLISSHASRYDTYIPYSSYRYDILFFHNKSYYIYVN